MEKKQDKPLHKLEDCFPLLHLIFTFFNCGTDEKSNLFILDGESFNTVVQSEFETAASAVGGLAFYGKLFHVFGQVRYVLSRHDSQQYQASLNEFRLSFGLGFNLF